MSSSAPQADDVPARSKEDVQNYGLRVGFGSMAEAPCLYGLETAPRSKPAVQIRIFERSGIATSCAHVVTDDTPIGFLLNHQSFGESI